MPPDLSAPAPPHHCIFAFSPSDFLDMRIFCLKFEVSWFLAAWYMILKTLACLWRGFHLEYTLGPMQLRAIDSRPQICELLLREKHSSMAAVTLRLQPIKFDLG